jgi:hypothetical protein
MGVLDAATARRETAKMLGRAFILWKGIIKASVWILIFALAAQGESARKRMLFESLSHLFNALRGSVLPECRDRNGRKAEALQGAHGAKGKGGGGSAATRGAQPRKTPTTRKGGAREAPGSRGWAVLLFALSV